MGEIIGRYELGDMTALYLTDTKKGNAELLLLPAGTEYKERIVDAAHDHRDSVVQVKLAGDPYTGGYSQGVSMRGDTACWDFAYDSQICSETDGVISITTELKDSRSHVLIHHLAYRKGSEALSSCSVFRNDSDQDVTLEMLSSFSLGGISPLMSGDGHDTLKLHRFRGVWSMEGRKETIPLEDLQLEPSWGGHAIRCERFGSVGSLPTNRFFPTMAIEDSASQIYWGASIAHNASWQMEVYRKGFDVQISGGMADREFGHWMKKIGPKESFATPVAYLSVYRGEDEEEIYRRLASPLSAMADMGPECEQELPVMFNEYCTTWGNPSHENITQIVDKIKDRGFKYFVIDCGWYKLPDVPWDRSMGDYDISKELFPEGLDKTVAAIKDAGMKPGIWFEIDNVGSASKAYQDEEHLLKRDGYVLTTTARRFWDLRQEYVQKYLEERVIGTLKNYGFEYLKIDCNDSIGIGCDGAESQGEGLRQNQEASIAFIKEIKEKIPGIVIENCASGGHKIEPLMMSECAMASFSDAHECEEIPIIAANLHRLMQPRQSQIWAVIRQKDTPKRIVYSVANTFLGRMCISGEVHLISDEQWGLIDKGIAFYNRIAPIIKNGRTYFYGPKITSYRHPEGWQGIVRYGEGRNVGAAAGTTDGAPAGAATDSASDTMAGAAIGEHDAATGTTIGNGTDSCFVLLHGFNGAAGQHITIDLKGDYRISEIYSYKDEDIELSQGRLAYTFTEDMQALAVLLSRFGS